MKGKLQWILMALALVVFATACDKEEEEQEPTETEILNQWIWDVMNDVYFWAEDVPQDLDPMEESDPEAFFYKLLHPDDRFSWIVDDYEELQKSFNNIEEGNGISPYFIRISGTDEVILVAAYIVKGSPAEDAGLTRGEIVTRINDQVITIDNYLDLFYADDVTLEFSDYDEEANTLTANGKEVTLQAEVIDENPVHHYEVIDYEDLKIGYL